MSLYDDASLAPSNDIPLHRVLAAYASCVARYLELQAIEDDETRVRRHPLSLHPKESTADKPFCDRPEKAKLLVVALQRTETFFNVLRPMLDREPPLDGAPTLQESSQTVRVLRVRPALPPSLAARPSSELVSSLRLAGELLPRGSRLGRGRACGRGRRRARERVLRGDVRVRRAARLVAPGMPSRE